MARVPDARFGEHGSPCGNQGGFDCDARTVDLVPRRVLRSHRDRWEYSLAAYPCTRWCTGASGALIAGIYAGNLYLLVRGCVPLHILIRRNERGRMSLQMRLVHARMGLTPPALHTEEAARDMAAHAPQQEPMPERMRARFTETRQGGVTRVTPKQGMRAGGALMFVHGGAYLFPLVDGQWGVVEGLIDRTGLPVIIPDYPLAPDHTATEAFDFVQPIIDEAKVEFGRVIIFGDSAGGGLALSLAMQRRDAGAPQVDGLVLYAPWVDVTMTNSAIKEVQGRDKILRAPGLEWAGRAWAGEMDPADWRVSPLYGDPAGLPPMRVFQGDADILGPDAIAFARKAARAGVDVRLRVEPDGFHVYVLSAAVIPEAGAALDHSARFISGILTQA